jgi:hypothetical protein
MNTALQLNGQLSAQLQDAYTRIHELQQQQIDAAAATVAEYVDTAEPSIDVDPAAEARTQAIQVVTQIAQTYGPVLIQAALARFTSPQSAITLAPPAPSSPTPPAAPTAPAAAAVPVSSPVPAPPSPSPRRVQRASIRPAPARAAPRARK